MEDIFKKWVPQWLVKVVLFSGLMPSMFLFFLPTANIPVTAGYYGCQPSDVQFLVVLFYAGFAGFYILERRFFMFFPVKSYYFIFIVLQIVNCLLMAYLQDVIWVYPLRFVQGMLFASAVNLSISMIFSRLRSPRAKEGSYAVFFGMLLCSAPFNSFMTVDIIDSFNFNTLYLYAAYAFLPGMLLIMICMRTVVKVKPYPLFSLDWSSFMWYSGLLVCYGYMMVYGQELYWFSDGRMQVVLALAVLFTLLFVLRQHFLKRIYIHLSIFKSRSMGLGLLMLFLMYIERFSLGITLQYMQQVLGVDNIHQGYYQWFTILGIVLGVLFSFYWLLVERPVKHIWLIGFSVLLLFHQMMFYSFEGEGDDSFFWGFLVLQGFGVGTIMVPTILFVVHSVKSAYAISAAAICLAIRYLGFTSSIGLQNFFKLFESRAHHEAFSQQLEVNNPIFQQNMGQHARQLLQQGYAADQQPASLQLLMQRVQSQSFIRYAMDYYELMSLLCVVILVWVCFMPTLKSTYQKIKANFIAPV